jgi:hypothetical protein
VLFLDVAALYHMQGTAAMDLRQAKESYNGACSL